MSDERFATAAPLPDRIHRLHELALDLWWSWDVRARQVFRRLDYELWRATAHNPVKMLQTISAERLAAAAAEPEYLQAYDEAIFGLDQARSGAHPWWKERAGTINGGVIAYFSAEFALHQSLPIYAGGLGRARVSPPMKATDEKQAGPATTAPGAATFTATDAEAKTFHDGMAGMSQGSGGSFDRLDEHLKEAK